MRLAKRAGRKEALAKLAREKRRPACPGTDLFFSVPSGRRLLCYFAARLTLYNFYECALTGGSYAFPSMASAGLPKTRRRTLIEGRVGTGKAAAVRGDAKVRKRPPKNYSETLYPE